MADNAVERISRFGFARGAVVRLNGSDRNMIVIRGLDETTACVVVEGDSAGTLRLREFPTADLTLMRVEVEEDDSRELRINDLERTFDLRWAADMRAIKRWQEAGTGRELTLPDRADLCVFLLDRLTELESPNQQKTIADQSLEIARLNGGIGRLREALEKIKTTGTRHETVRTGDMYADDGYSDYEIVSDEAQIARAALQTDGGKL